MGVPANRGAAGIDRQTMADVEESGVSRLLDELAACRSDGTRLMSGARGLLRKKLPALREAVRRHFSSDGVHARVHAHHTLPWTFPATRM